MDLLSKSKRDCLKKKVFYQILLDSQSHPRPGLCVFQPFVTIFSTHCHEKWRHLLEIVINNNNITKVTILCINVYL